MLGDPSLRVCSKRLIVVTNHRDKSAHSHCPERLQRRSVVRRKSDSSQNISGPANIVSIHGVSGLEESLPMKFALVETSRSAPAAVPAREVLLTSGDRLGIVPGIDAATLQCKVQYLLVFANRRRDRVKNLVWGSRRIRDVGYARDAVFWARSAGLCWSGSTCTSKCPLCPIRNCGARTAPQAPVKCGRGSRTPKPFNKEGDSTTRTSPCRSCGNCAPSTMPARGRSKWRCAKWAYRRPHRGGSRPRGTRQPAAFGGGGAIPQSGPELLAVTARICS